MPAAVEHEIRSCAQTFAAEVISLFQDAVMRVAEDKIERKSSLRASPAKKASKPVRAAAVKDTNKLEASLLALLKKNKQGLSAERINAALGTSSKDIAKPLLSLLVKKLISRTGQARGTQYHAAG